jgi:hypothetical protein
MRMTKAMVKMKRTKKKMSHRDRVKRRKKKKIQNQRVKVNLKAKIKPLLRQKKSQNVNNNDRC